MTTWRVAGIALLVVSAFLLLSMGGAIVAAPITVPLLFVVARKRSTATFTGVAAILAAATVAEFAWALTYLAIGEAKPWIWLLPIAAAAATAVALVKSTPRRAPTVAAA